MNKINELDRRTLFAAGAAGAAGLAALAGLAGRAEAAPPTDEDKANIKLVNGFCKAWEGKATADNLMSFMTDDCIYQIGYGKPFVGRDEVRDRYVKFLPGNITYKLNILETFAKDPLVLNVRRDENITEKGDRILGHIGLFIIKNGKIAEWRDVPYKVT